MGRINRFGAVVLFAIVSASVTLVFEGMALKLVILNLQFPTSIANVIHVDIQEVVFNCFNKTTPCCFNCIN